MVQNNCFRKSVIHKPFKHIQGFDKNGQPPFAHIPPGFTGECVCGEMDRRENIYTRFVLPFVNKLINLRSKTCSARSATVLNSDKGNDIITTV